MEPVVLLTHSGDFFTVDRVQAAVEARGARALRVDTDRFPVELPMVAEPNGGVRLGDVDLGEARVWSRRLWPGRLPTDIDPRFAAHAQRESRRAFFDALVLVERPTWMNAFSAQSRAENKLLQLREAAALGLQVPPTVVTNAPAAVRALRPPLATKLLGALSQTMDASGDFLYTRRIPDTSDLRGLELCPQIFQPWLNKRRELRVIVVDDRVFAGAIEPGDREDWREMKPGEARWREAALPDDQAERVVALTRALGLRFGAVDLVVDDDEVHWFLEINPAGEWGWLERDLGFDISGAIAEALLR